MSCCDDKAQKGQEKAGLKGLVTGPRRWMLLGAVAVSGGLAMGWDQLVLFGVAPLLVSLLPCLVMCGLGLCIMKCKDKTNKSTDQGEATDAQAGVEVSTAAPSANHQAADHQVPPERSTSKLQA